MVSTAVVRVIGRGGHLDFTLDDAVSFYEVEQGLREYLNRVPGRFSGISITVNLGRRLLDSHAVGVLRHLLEIEHEAKIVGFWAGAGVLEKAFSEQLGVPVTVGPKPRQTQSPDPQRHPGSLDETLLVRTTCRTGTSLRHEGNIVILGNVNPGAEVIAGGDIVVFGVVRGVAHAGANNAEGSVIIAQALRPTQLRIAEHIAIGPSEQPRAGTATRPEVAFVSGGAIVVVPYLSKAWRALEEKWKKVGANGRKNHRRNLR